MISLHVAEYDVGLCVCAAFSLAFKFGRTLVYPSRVDVLRERQVLAAAEQEAPPSCALEARGSGAPSKYSAVAVAPFSAMSHEHTRHEAPRSIEQV